jgi:hypothetical protein
MNVAANGVGSVGLQHGLELVGIAGFLVDRDDAQFLGGAAGGAGALEGGQARGLLARGDGGVEIEILEFGRLVLLEHGLECRFKVDAIGVEGQAFQHQVHDRDLA